MGQAGGLGGEGPVAGAGLAGGQHVVQRAVRGDYWGCARMNHCGWTGHRVGVRPWVATKLWNRAHWPGSANRDRLSAHRLSFVAILVL